MTSPVSTAARNPLASLASRVFAPTTELRAAVLAGILLALGVALHVLAKVPNTEWLIWSSLGIGMLYGGKAAVESLREGKFDIDVLMIVAAGLAAFVGHPEEGALLLFLFVLAGALEDRAMARTKREIEALHKLMPTAALVWRPATAGTTAPPSDSPTQNSATPAAANLPSANGRTLPLPQAAALDNPLIRGPRPLTPAPAADDLAPGEWVQIEPEALRVGERVKIRPGDRVPTDARVVRGQTSMDQSAITGESMPRAVTIGDDLYAGTINAEDVIEAVVTRTSRESSLQKILNLVTEAREQREPVQRTIDRISQPYSIGVMVISVLVLLIWWLAFGRDLKDAAYTAITLLIVMSPCALVIATPTATLSAIARAARQGVLFKGGQSIEALARTAGVCFDKTGTLTFGRPTLYEVHPVAWSDGRSLLAMAAGLEADSSHPIAQAVKDAAKQRGVEPAAVDNIDHTVGRGMSGLFHGCPVRLGSYKHVEELIPICFRNRTQDVLRAIQSRGHIGVVVAHACTGKEGGGEVAVLIMADAVRPGAHTLVRELHALGVKPVRMLTGDNAATAQRVGSSLGIDIIDAELLPEDKVRIVQSMKSKALNAEGVRSLFSAPPGGVAVIGDGVNDAPALAAADVSIAIGSIGTDAALESADIVLLSDDLAVVPWSVRLARRARTTVRVNLVFALGAIVIMAIFTLIGSLTGLRVPMSVGVLAHEGGTLLVVANSLRLLMFKGVTIHAANQPPPPPARHASPQHATAAS